MIAAGSMLLAIAAPALCFSPATRSLIFSSDHDLTISWQARIFADQAQFRLYRVEYSGAEVLLEQKTADAGIRNFRYIDRTQNTWQPIRFRLCVLNANGSERTLGVIDCFQIAMEADDTIANPSTDSFSALPILRALIRDASKRATKIPAPHCRVGARPCPPVPPPRNLV
jgi:hypothetical protein